MLALAAMMMTVGLFGSAWAGEPAAAEVVAAKPAADPAADPAGDHHPAGRRRPDLADRPGGGGEGPSPYPGGPTVELRWSPKCETSWVRGCCYANYRIRGYFSSTSGLRTLATAYGLNTGSRIYSAMLDNSYPAGRRGLLRRADRRHPDLEMRPQVVAGR